VRGVFQRRCDPAFSERLVRERTHHFANGNQRRARSLAAYARYVQARFMRPAPEIVLFPIAGLFLAIVGAYGTVQEPIAARFAFWILNMLGSGILGVTVDGQLRNRIPNDWIRALLTSAIVTPPIALIVLGSMVAVLRHHHADTLRILLMLSWQVFLVTAVLMSLRALIRRRPTKVFESVTVIMPQVPEAEARFRRHLSARGRGAKLLAIEAHDHYVRVHTAAGTELVSLRFTDAIEELADVAGFRVHRSWWVAADAIESARWHRSSGLVRLKNGLATPISRSGAPILRAAGWL
jgi:hypothetical protein